MKRKKLAAFGLVIALTASSSSAAFAAAVPAASNMETTAVQQMDQAEETDTDILSDSEAVELQQEIASYSNDGILLTAASYKGKGIKYVDEHIRRKEGKAGKGGKK